MTKEALYKYLEEEYSTLPDYPWADDPYAVFRHVHNNKWFLLHMPISERKLGFDSDKIVDVINVKTDPMMLPDLIKRKGIHRAYHMNKTMWISIRIGTASNKDIKDLIDLSYRLTEK